MYQSVSQNQYNTLGQRIHVHCNSSQCHTKVNHHQTPLVSIDIVNLHLELEIALIYYQFVEGTCNPES